MPFYGLGNEVSFSGPVTFGEALSSFVNQSRSQCVMGVDDTKLFIPHRIYEENHERYLRTKRQGYMSPIRRAYLSPMRLVYWWKSLFSKENPLLIV